MVRTTIEVSQIIHHNYILPLIAAFAVLVPGVVLLLLCTFSIFQM